MKHLLRGLLAWMERKFPDRVVVTQLEYNALSNSLEIISGTLSDLTGRVVKLEFEVNKFNVAMGFGTRGSSLVGSLER
jgi:hypothetical protein